MYEKNYELIWFCYNIEHVFLGQTVTKDEKVMTVNKFARMNFDFNKIKKNLSSIDNERCIPQKSNIITILDKYFVKKQK